MAHINPTRHQAIQNRERPQRNAMSRRDYRRDSRRTSRVSHALPDPTRPIPVTTPHANPLVWNIHVDLNPPSPLPSTNSPQTKPARGKK